jgi:hypothetical protein
VPQHLCNWEHLIRGIYHVAGVNLSGLPFGNVRSLLIAIVGSWTDDCLKNKGMSSYPLRRNPAKVFHDRKGSRAALQYAEPR